MSRPVVIVDPLDAGVELAPAFKACGIPAIAVTVNTDWSGYGMKIQAGDFMEMIPDQPNLVEILKSYDPVAIIPGAEEGVALAEHLSAVLTPQYANDQKKLKNRLHKALMQDALSEAGIPTIKTLNTASEVEVAFWLKENNLVGSPLILKPPMSSGSDKVFHIGAGDDWRPAFNRVLSEPAKLTGKASETVVIQEEAIGTEFAVGTVSANGKHYLAHLIKYNKTSAHGRKTIFDYVEFLPFDQNSYGAIFDYTKKALDALGVCWGAAHTEIMVTQSGPRLIESGARMCGGPVVHFARAATGSSQADKLVEIYTHGDVVSQYHFRQSVVPVFLKSSASGRVSNAEVFDQVSQLPTLLNQYLWFNNGDIIPQTVDYLTSIGIVALAGDRSAIMHDYAKIRKIESRLIIDPVDDGASA